MSRLYDTIEPSVVDQIMLEQNVYSQGPQGVAGELAKKEGVKFETVPTLRLDYQNILRIDNLYQFTNLVKLQLDNNIIEKIEGLDHLVHLKWVDLSFNNIEEIGGLEKLVNIEDLTLYNNRISKLENLDTLQKLHVLSVGNNLLSQTADLIYLRRFPTLQSVCLRGNPLCDLPEYVQALYAFLPDLIYMDYKKTNPSLRPEAYEKYQLVVDEMIAQEKADREERERKANAIKESNLHREAFVEGLNSEDIFEHLYIDDEEGKELRQVPEFSHSIQTFSEAFTKECKAVFELGMIDYEKRQLEVEDFQSCMIKTEQENDRQGTQLLEGFRVYQQEKSLITKKVMVVVAGVGRNTCFHLVGMQIVRNHMSDRDNLIHQTYDGNVMQTPGVNYTCFRKFEKLNDPIAIENGIKEYTDELQKLRYELMKTEMVLVEQLEELINEFELNMKDSMATFIEHVEGHFAECREQQAQFNERLTDISPAVLERIIRGDSEVTISESLLTLFIDKESITNALQASNDVHLLQLDGLADNVGNQARKWLEDMIEQLQETEGYQRNRSRVMEINEVVDAFRDDLDALDLDATASTVTDK